MLRLICLIIGYAFGCLQWAYIIGRMKGIDIRQYGSGNSGTTNAMRVMGTKAGLYVFFLDLIKAAVALTVVRFTIGSAHPEQMYLLMIYTLAGCVIGHDFPFYMGFKGGKGVAVMAGFCIAFHWTFLPFGILVFFVPFLITHYVSLGSLLVYGGCWIFMIIEGQMGVYAPQNAAANTEMYIVMALLAAMCYYRHRANILRLIHGEERKTYILHREKDTK